MMKTEEKLHDFQQFPYGHLANWISVFYLLEKLEVAHSMQIRKQFYLSSLILQTSEFINSAIDSKIKAKPCTVSTIQNYVIIIYKIEHIINLRMPSS